MTSPSQIQTLLQTAMRHAQARDFAKAEAACRKALDLSPNEHDALQLLGLIVQERGARKEAETLFRRSLHVEPRQAHVWNNLGNLLQKGETWRDAGACYQEAVALAPAYLDGWLNLARYHDRADDRAAALEAIERALAIKPGHPKALAEKGRLLNLEDRADEAKPILMQVVEAHPDYVEAIHNLGVSLRQLGQPQDAIVQYRKAIALRTNVPAMHYNLGNALYDAGKVDDAIAAYWHAIDLQPDYPRAHETLNKVLWEHDRREDFGTSLSEAIKKAPQSGRLPALFARLLLQSGDLDRAGDVVDDATDRIGPTPQLNVLKAKIETERGNAAAARAHFEAAIAAEPEDISHRHTFARLLIKTADYRTALQHLKAAHDRAPQDQQTLAYLGLCWRLTGDAKAAWLNDYERFIKPCRLEALDGYANLAAFNSHLRETLHRLHTAKRHPIDQTLRGGTQTKGALFKQGVPEIQKLKSAFEAVVRDYIAGLPDDPDHPFLSRKRPDFRFSGSWSVQLSDKGFHVNHVHAQGWISSAYYVSLPDCISEGPDHQGWLTFGETNMSLGEREQTARRVKPEEGMLVLFPSYMYHGTVPFEAPQRRLTVAFDVVPLN